MTYDQIQAQVTDLINSDTRFDRFRESAIAQTLIEIFTGTTDIVNYYLNRRAEECYFDTAQLRSSVISLSRMFGYVMNRKEPARAFLRMTIKGDIGDNQVQIPYYSKFSYGGDNFVLINTMTYRIPDAQYNLMNKDSEIVVDRDSFGAPIEIAQGTIKEKVISGRTNPQIGAPFQIYKIEDDTFSNSYGDKDFFYNDVTQVYVGQEKTEDNRFSIDRRSLLNWETIDTSDLSRSQQVCVIRTTPDGYVEILFGDGSGDITVSVSAISDQNPRVGSSVSYNGQIYSVTGIQNGVVFLRSNNDGGFARKGAITREDNVYVQYLSTNGKKSNKAGVIGEKVNFSGKIFNSKGEDITSKIKFELLSNVSGGADDESSDSIKYSSPKIYYSLDRLVSLDDYLAFMKSLNSPINVRNAIAWGEQQERDLYGKFAIRKMFNAVFFTVIGSLYDLDANPHQMKKGDQLGDVVMDLNYDPYRFQTQGYLNVFVLQEQVNQLNRYSTLTTFKEIDGVNFNPSGDLTDVDVADSIKQSIQTNFPNGKATINFTYTSDDKENVSNILAHGSVNIENLNSVSLTQLNGNTYLSSIANIVNTALLGFKDHRGNKTDNANFDKQAFIGRWDVGSSDNALIKWDAFEDESSNAYTYSYRLRFNESERNNGEDPTPCYIVEFDDSEASFLGVLGLGGKESFDVSFTNQENEMNGKIDQVVSELTKRSQVNVKNIYLSPIIQRFNIEGDIFVKPLYDKEEVRREITNSLYQWFDINSDFNTPIYMSNIVDLIEDNTGVINTNIRIVPEDITAGPNNTRNLYYEPDHTKNSVYRKYTINGENEIAEIVNNKIAEYIGSGSYYYESERRNFYVDSIFGRSISSEHIFLKNDINERSFYDRFAGELYNYFKTRAGEQNCSGTNAVCPNGGEPNFGRFIGLPGSIDETFGSDVIHESVTNTDFSVIMEQIHKDLSFIIKENMIDSNGNIDREIDSNSEYVRGGYTLGSEIVQFNLRPEDGDGRPLLNFRYK